MSKIFAIYPTDERESTKFLNKINTYLKIKLGSNWHCYKVKFNDEDHNRCLEQARGSDAKFILFMGHGRSDCLYGSCAKEAHEFVSQEAIAENPHIYRKENFIHAGNISNFSNKVLFSFSCNSNKNTTNSIGRKAIENGVVSFVGFGDITTDFIEEDNFPKKAIEVFKYLITKIIKESLYISVINNYTVDRLVDLIKINTYKEIQKLLCTKNRHKKIIIEKLILFKNEIVIFGNKFEYVV
jgi:hypothetical protein